MKLEEMASFFDDRVQTYDTHMKETIDQFDVLYEEVANCVPDYAKDVLVLGSGTGTDLELLLERLPETSFVCVDMSSEMLIALERKFPNDQHRIKTIQGSYFEVTYKNKFDAVVAVMTMHHWDHDEKNLLYTGIKSILKPGGCYIEGDYYVKIEDEMKFLNQKKNLLEENDLDMLYHIDIPFNHSTQENILVEVGFINFERIYVYRGKEVHCCNVL